MEQKTIRLALSKYKKIPTSLVGASPWVAKEHIFVDMARLFHHYYLDTRGFALPDPDLAHFEHIGFFCAEPELRLIGDGIGISRAFRVSRSNELGQAFCRWFLYEYFNITYFAHMHDVLDKPAHPAFFGYRVCRKKGGDTPTTFVLRRKLVFFWQKPKGGGNLYPSIMRDLLNGDSNSTGLLL